MTAKERSNNTSQQVLRVRLYLTTPAYSSYSNKIVRGSGRPCLLLQQSDLHISGMYDKYNRKCKQFNQMSIWIVCWSVSILGMKAHRTKQMPVLMCFQKHNVSTLTLHRIFSIWVNIFPKYWWQCVPRHLIIGCLNFLIIMIWAWLKCKTGSSDITAIFTVPIGLC